MLAGFRLVNPYAFNHLLAKLKAKDPLHLRVAVVLVGLIASTYVLIISCWGQHFEHPGDGTLQYVDSLSRWNGSNRAGWKLLRRHLEMTMAGKLEVRLVLAKTDNPAAVAKGGDASKLNNTFSTREDLIGRLTQFDD